MVSCYSAGGAYLSILSTPIFCLPFAFLFSSLSLAFHYPDLTFSYLHDNSAFFFFLLIPCTPLSAFLNFVNSGILGFLQRTPSQDMSSFFWENETDVFFGPMTILCFFFLLQCGKYWRRAVLDRLGSKASQPLSNEPAMIWTKNQDWAGGAGEN